MTAPNLPPIGPDLRVWASQLTRFLLRGLVRLNFLGQGDTPSENGIIFWDEDNQWPVISKNGEFLEVMLYDRHPYLVTLPESYTPDQDGIVFWDDTNNWPVVSKNSEMVEIVTRDRHPYLNALPDAYTPPQDGLLFWDATNGYPVVSKNGEMRQIVLEDGHYQGGITTNVTAAAADTAYALTYTAQLQDGIVNGTPASRLVVDEAGYYQVSFSAQISSSSASSVKFYFWPRVNGTDVAGATMVNTLHNNGASVVTSRTAAFELAAGDYIEAMWAVDSTDGFLEAAAATAFAPAAPASTISIVRLHG